MAKRDSGHPAFPVGGKNVYKFDKDLDAQVRGGMAPQLGADPAGGVVREGAFRARRDAQINKRKKAGY